MVRAWRTAPNAPYPPASDEIAKTSTPPHLTTPTKPASAVAAAAAVTGKSAAFSIDTSSTVDVTVENGTGNGSGGGAGNGVGVAEGAGAMAARGGKAGGPGAGAEGGDAVRFVGHSRPVYGISWSPDGRFLLSAGGDGEVRLWDMARGRAGNAAGYVRYDGHW